MRIFLTCVSCFLSVTLFSQQTIRGRVVNEATGAPVPGSSVFVTNTSKGTTADQQGNFILTDLPPGKHDLVISSIGYETNVFSFSSDQLPLQLKIEMQLKVKELENVTIEPSVEEGWDKWGQTFMDYFIGNTENAPQCRLKNPKAIKFRYYKKSNRLKAYADEQLVLENKALGYTIRYQLEAFDINFKENSFLYLGYSYFSDMDKKGPSRRQRNKREEAYTGSILHFMRSLYNNRLKEEGFEVRRMTRTPNLEKQRVRNRYTRRIIKPIDGISITQGGDRDTAISKDSMDYYQRIMQQGDYIETYGRELLTADSLLTNGTNGNKILHFDNYIFITCTRELEEERYARRGFSPRKPTNQMSYVMLFEGTPITIDGAGNYYNPKDFYASGYWAWGEKMADNMPVDYEMAGKGK